MRDIILYFFFGGLCFNLITPSATVLPLVPAVVVGASLLAVYFRPPIVDETLGIAESCNGDWIPMDLDGMERELGERVYGQELAISVLMREIRNHQESRSSAPLLLGFNGMPGTGKTLALSIILKHYFKDASKSRFFKYYSASKHVTNTDDRVFRLQEELWGLARSCDSFVYVMDEVDKLPSHLLDSILYPLFFLKDFRSVNMRKSLIILMSNAGQDFIAEKALDYWKQGVDRSSIVYDDFITGFHNHILGLRLSGYNSNLIKNGVLKLYIPFLPLERAHVVNCIKEQLVGLRVTPDQSMFDRILNEISFDRDYDIFSEAGCKGIAIAVLRAKDNNFGKVS